LRRFQECGSGDEAAILGNGENCAKLARSHIWERAGSHVILHLNSLIDLPSFMRRQEIIMLADN